MSGELGPRFDRIEVMNRLIEAFRGRRVSQEEITVLRDRLNPDDQTWFDGLNKKTKRIICIIDQLNFDEEQLDFIYNVTIPGLHRLKNQALEYKAFRSKLKR